MTRYLYFTAAWCTPCAMFKPVVQEVSQEQGVSFEFIDIDTNPILMQKYAISSVPTIIIEKEGLPVYRHSGITSKSQITAAIKRAVG